MTVVAVDPPYTPVVARPLSTGGRALLKTAANNAAATQYTWVSDTYPGTSTITSFGGTTEDYLRPPADIAFGLAALYATGNHDPAMTGIAGSAVLDAVIRLTTSFAGTHAANGGNWGGNPIPAGTFIPDGTTYEWQGAFWVASAATAARLVWDSLTAGQRAAIDAMVTLEANRFLTYSVPYMRDRGGRVLAVFTGNTKGEENAWNAWVLFLAAATQPTHANAPAWLAKAVELSLAATATPFFPTSKRPWHGAFSGWGLAAGSNIDFSGWVENHGIVHPNYVAALGQSWVNGLTFAWLRGGKIPAATLANAPLVYQSLVDITFTPPQAQAPGGKVYTPGSSAIYYPGGPDGDATRMASYMGFDALAHVVRADSWATVPADTWLGLHAGNQISQQAGGGRRSAWDLANASYALSADWIAATVAPATSNEPIAALLA